MLKVGKRLVENSLTKDELLTRVEVKKTESSDFDKLCEILAKSFGLSSINEAKFQLTDTKIKLDESVKLVDKDTNEIYGVLMLCDYMIQRGSPIEYEDWELSYRLRRYKQINGFAFFIDERLRNCGLDKKMLTFNLPYLKENYDFIWIGVERSLRSRKYWERLGFVKLFEIPQATFYLSPLNKKLSL